MFFCTIKSKAEQIVSRSDQGLNMLFSITWYGTSSATWAMHVAGSKYLAIGLERRCSSIDGERGELRESSTVEM